MTEPRAIRRLTVAILIPVLAFLTLASWSLSSPAGSSPDDDFHLASIWCGLGERAGVCENPNDDPTERYIPESVVNSKCYAFNPGQSGACWKSEEPGMAAVERANVDGLYPRVFYATMSVFASPNAGASVVAMRLFNSALVVGVLTLTFFQLPRRLRPALVVSAIATAVPLGMFVYGSTNPSSWAFLSAAVVWISMLGALQTAGRQRIILLALTLLGVIIGAGARADAAVFAVFGIGIAFLIGWRPRRDQLLPVGVAVAAVVVAVAFYLSAWQGGSIVGGLESDRPPLTAGDHFSNFLAAPSLWVGAFGGWALGWLDTGMPSAVTVLATAVFWGALFIGIGNAGIRRGIAVTLGIGAMWLVPVILLGQSKMSVGELIQPRYLVPLMIITVGVASCRWDAARAWRGMRVLLAGAALAFANALALHVNIQRYTTGSDVLHLDPGVGAEWWWAHAPSPLVVWLGGSLAFAAIFVVLWGMLRGDEAVAVDGFPDRGALPAGAAPVVTSTAAA